MPPADRRDTAEAEAHVVRTTRVLEPAGRHFNRGQRAFFFALGYLGWFVSPWVLFVSTAAVVIVTWRRQFASSAWAAMAPEVAADDEVTRTQGRRCICCGRRKCSTPILYAVIARREAYFLRIIPERQSNLATGRSICQSSIVIVDKSLSGVDRCFIVAAIHVDHPDWTIMESYNHCTISGHFCLQARRDDTREPEE